jgi:hypothetical protein
LQNQLDTVNYSINDTTCFFDLNVGSNLIITLSSINRYPVWQQGYLGATLRYFQVSRYLDSKVAPDSIVTYSNGSTDNVRVKLARGVGPMIIYFMFLGLVSDNYMNASLLACTLRKQ